MLDRAFAKVVRNLPALFLVVAAVTLPLHLAHAFVFRNVVGVLELRHEIATFPGERQVRAVGTAQLRNYDVSYWLLVLGEVAALPLAARAARRVVDAAGAGELVTIRDAWKAARTESHPRWTDVSNQPIPLLVAAAVALVAGALVWKTGMPLAGFMPPGARFVGVAVTEALARAAGAPFFLVALSEAARATRPAPKEPNLY